MARQARLGSTPLDAAHLHANATQRRAVEGNLGGLCVCPDLRTKRPRRGLRAEAACVGTPGWVGPRGEVVQPRVLALRYELGRFNSLGPLQALILSLRIANGFCQHLAQLSLGLRGFPLGWLPFCHKQYVVMREGKLNPQGCPRQSCGTVGSS